MTARTGLHDFPTMTNASGTPAMSFRQNGDDSRLSFALKVESFSLTPRLAIRLSHVLVERILHVRGVIRLAPASNVIHDDPGSCERRQDRRRDGRHLVEFEYRRIHVYEGYLKHGTRIITLNLHPTLAHHRVLTLVKLNANNTEVTDFEICMSGGRVLANVGNAFLSDVS